jgi:hypothetical protein
MLNTDTTWRCFTPGRAESPYTNLIRGLIVSQNWSGYIKTLACAIYQVIALESQECHKIHPSVPMRVLVKG